MSNRISRVKDFVDHNAVKNNIANITNNDIRQTEFLFDYALLDIENEEKDKLRKHEKSLLFHKKQINKATADMGRALAEAREVFIKSHSESFVDWYEQLGFSKDQVSVAMNRYQLTVEYPNAKDNIINLSDIAIKELVNKKTPLSIKEKVIEGKIITGQQIREERKNNSIAVEKFEEVEEAELVHKRNSIEETQTVLRKLKIKISEIDSYILGHNGIDNESFIKLEKLLNEISGIELK